MNRIDSIEGIKSLIKKHFKPGMVTNCFLPDDTIVYEINDGTLYAEEKEDFLFIYRLRKDFQILNFYLNSPVTEFQTVPTNTVCEIPYRIKDTSLVDTSSRLQENGFSLMFTRKRLLFNGNCEHGYENDNIRYAEYNDIDSVKLLYETCFDRRTGCIPTITDINYDIMNKNYLLYCLPEGVAGFLHCKESKNLNEIRHLAVSEKYRGKHIASELTKIYLSNVQCKSRVWVRSDNIPALCVYNNNGFIEDGYKSDVLIK